MNRGVRRTYAPITSPGGSDRGVITDHCLSHRRLDGLLLFGAEFGGLDFRLAVHPLVKPGALETPAIAQLECRYEAFGGVLVEGVGRDAEVIRRLADIHHFANFRDEEVGTGS